MGDTLNIRTTYSHIDNVQRVQQTRHAEQQAHQQQTSSQVVRQADKEDRQVVSTHKTEKDRVGEKKDGDSGGGAGADGEQKRQDASGRDADQGQDPGQGSVIDVQV